MKISETNIKVMMLFFAIVMLIMFCASTFSLYPEQQRGYSHPEIATNPFIQFSVISSCLWMYFNPSLLTGGFQEYKEYYRLKARYKWLNRISMVLFVVGLVDVFAN